MGGHTVELDDVPVCIGQLPVLHMESAMLSEGVEVTSAGPADCIPGASSRCLFGCSGAFTDGFRDGSRRFGEADVVASFDVSCLPQPARAQVPKAASTAQLSVF